MYKKTIWITGASGLLENLMLKMTELPEMPGWREDLRAYIEKNTKKEENRR